MALPESFAPTSPPNDAQGSAVCTGTPKSDPPDPPLLLVIRCVPLAPVNCQRSPVPEQVVPVNVSWVLNPPNWKREPPFEVIPRMWASSEVTTVSMSQSPDAGLPPWASPEKALSMFPSNSELSVGVGSMNQTLAFPLMFTSPPVGQPSPSKLLLALPPQLVDVDPEFIVTVMSMWLSPGADGRLRLAITCSQPSSAASTPARAASA